jgi:uncharacterized protein
MKYLLVLIVVLIGFMLLKKQFVIKKKPGAKASRAEDPQTLRETERMLRCAHCGIFVPGSAALHIQGRHYCSQEHAQKAESQSVRDDKDTK